MITKENRLQQPEVFNEKAVIPLWSVMVWLIVMNSTMFNVALPSVLREFTLTAATGSWIVTGYSIFFAIATVTYGRLSDFVPIQRLLYIGLTILGIASIIGFLSNHFYVLMFARLLQAAGASAVPGLGMVLVARYVPLARRGKAMSLISSAASLGFGLGPVIGGWITQFLGWNYLFIITGLVLTLIPFFQKYLPEEPSARISFDIWGGILVGVGVTSLLLFLTSFSYLFLFLSLLSCLFCWKHINRVSNPFIQPDLLKNIRFLMIVIIGFTAFFIHFSTLFAMPIVLSALFNQSSAQIGMTIFPGAMLSAIAAIFIGRAIDRFGNPLLMGIGHVLFVIPIILFSFFFHWSAYVLMVGYMFMSVGFTTLTSSLVNEISRILPKGLMGAGMGLSQLIKFFGGASGVAITGLIISLQEGVTGRLTYQWVFISFNFLFLLSMGLLVFYLRASRGESA